MKTLSSAQQNALLNYSWPKQGLVLTGKKHKQRKAIIKSLEKKGLISCEKQTTRITRKKKEMKIDVYFLTDLGKEKISKLEEKRSTKIKEIQDKHIDRIKQLEKEDQELEKKYRRKPIGVTDEIT